MRRKGMSAVSSVGRIEGVLAPGILFGASSFPGVRGAEAKLTGGEAGPGRCRGVKASSPRGLGLPQGGPGQ